MSRPLSKSVQTSKHDDDDYYYYYGDDDYDDDTDDDDDEFGTKMREVWAHPCQHS
jgi:hypothetical protein